jgi:hypothetical protein
MEVKLNHRDFVNWFIARRDRDRGALAKGHRKTAEPAKAVEKTEDKKAQEKPAEKTGNGKTEEKAASKANSPQRRAPSGPYVDTQLDRALEIIRARLAEVKAKNAI